MRQSLTFNIFHDQIGLISFYIKVEDLDDIGMTQTGHCYSLVLKADSEVGVNLLGIGRDNLNSYIAVKMWMVCLIHFSHAATSQEADDLILADVGRRW